MYYKTPRANFYIQADAIGGKASFREQSMTETLGEAYRRAIARVRAPESTGWAMITVEPAEAAREDSRFLGVAIVDGHWRVDMHSGHRTEFRVEAGEHTVEVQIKRRFWVAGYPLPARASLPVVARPGERIDLVFGAEKRRTPPVRPTLTLAHLPLIAAVSVSVATLCLTVLVVRNLVMAAAHTVGTGQTWLTLIQFVVSPTNALVLIGVCASTIVARASLAKRDDNVSRAIVHPCFLVRTSELRIPSAVFKEQYVDPFE